MSVSFEESVLAVGPPDEESASIRRLRRYWPHARTQPRITKPPQPRPSHGPIRTAGVTVSNSPTVVSTYACVRTGTDATTDPSGAMTPVMPLIAATTT